MCWSPIAYSHGPRPRQRGCTVFFKFWEVLSMPSKCQCFVFYLGRVLFVCWQYTGPNARSVGIRCGRPNNGFVEPRTIKLHVACGSFTIDLLRWLLTGHTAGMWEYDIVVGGFIYERSVWWTEVDAHAPQCSHHYCLFVVL